MQEAVEYNGGMLLSTLLLHSRVRVLTFSEFAGLKPLAQCLETLRVGN
jgi:hypothetical protein